ncbi:hypothetical protein I5L01_12785 [Erythrobacter sp. YJ-T3-07]|uniref:hypothetical protein n=1 Tax=Erythrobacter sp. YJ-T3-07 TaxID=2793063 RepID=UPI0018D49ED8|nr:hypothetical protein [Erythrobacter sp. YJ-T3-07]MBH1945099.1 hypothetical protein [Erythrobacter sp. YJ-T3-07]
MKMLTALAGAAFLAVAAPAVAMDTPPSDPGHGGGSSSGGTPVPAPPVAIIFGLAAGAMLVRRKLG